MKKTLTLLTFILVFNYSFSQKTELVKEWIMMDTLFISQVTKAHNISTDKLLEVLDVTNENRDNLGFNYELKEASNGKGYMSFWYKILYYKNQVIAYELTAGIPNKSKKVKNLYKEKLSHLFEISDDFKITPLTFGKKRASEPIIIQDLKSTKELEIAMNPFTGVIYGNYCGYGSSLLTNREAFDKIINPSNCEFLMYSKNPATRIMAVEYFYCNISDFNSIKINEIEKRIEEIKKYSPLTKTCGGCIIGRDRTKNIINKLKNCR
jgi:hypothetical protein